MRKNQAPSRRRKPASMRRTVTYNHIFAGPQPRPDVRMPVAAHQEVANLLKWVWIAAAGRDGVRNRIDEIRGELDEWVMREYGIDELDQETFLNLYYPAHGYQLYPTLGLDEMVRCLETVKEILALHYPDCAPLRSLLALANRAIASIHTWKVKAKTRQATGPASLASG